MRIFSAVPFAFLIFASLVGAAAAQVPDAGALRQQIERQPLAPPPAESGSPLRSDESAPIPLRDGARLTVKSFRFAGNTLLNDEQLEPAVRSWVNRPVGFAELQRAALAVATTYRDAGWIVFAYLPQQDVTEGVVTIQVTESRFAGAQLEGTPTARLVPEIALRRVQQEPDEPLSARALDRSLLLINDLPGVSVSGALAPGAREGATELSLRLTDERLFDGLARLDNGGARSTGEQRLILTGAINSPLRLGDRVRADLLHSEGTDYLRLAYGLPVGTNGWQVGANGSSFEYDLVGAHFTALSAAGRSSSFGVDASYPLLRSRVRNLYLNLAADERKFSNAALGVRQSDYAITSVSAGVTANVYDNVFRGGASSFTLSWRRGRLQQGQLQVGENQGLARDFDKLLYGVSRQQILTPTLSLYGALNGQYSNDALDSAERYYLGGPDGVRAYPSNDGGGNRGTLATVELRWLLHPAVTAAVFDDWGHFSNFDGQASSTLRSFGLRAEWRAPRGIQVEASYARRDGRIPNPGVNGAYHDGSHGRDRWWVQATLPF